MADVAAVRKEDGTVVCERCLVADSTRLRVKGLLGRSELPDGEGILITPCSSIHMFFMRFPIDAVFLDREMRVMKVVPGLRPWRMAAKRRARSVLELAAGATARAGVVEGERLLLGG
jgi:uncharacterized membrane protein (UPF0127 family)